MDRPSLLVALLAILREWIPVFPQARSGERAVEQALGALLSLGRRTLSRSLCVLGRHAQDWSADYKLHSRSQWDPQDLFQPILKQAGQYCAATRLVVAMDDTRIRKTGRKILSAFYQRDPQSPKFRFNLMWGFVFSTSLCWCPYTEAARKHPHGRSRCVSAKYPPSRNRARGHAGATADLPRSASHP